jgi:hypothetical protein
MDGDAGSLPPLQEEEEEEEVSSEDEAATCLMDEGQISPELYTEMQVQ